MSGHARPAGLRHLALVGCRGCGKSTIGRRVAELLELPFLDTDELIERETGRTIREIFRLAGEARFREYEADALSRALRGSPSVLALGGGGVVLDQNRRALKSRAYCIWLTATAAELARRLAGDPLTATQRPPLTDLDAEREIEIVLAQRAPLYAELAGMQLDTEALTIEQAALRVVEAWRQVQPRGKPA